MRESDCIDEKKWKRQRKKEQIEVRKVYVGIVTKLDL